MEIVRPLGGATSAIRIDSESALTSAADELELFVMQFRSDPEEADRLAEHLTKRLQIIRKELALAALRSDEPEIIPILGLERI